MSDPSKRETGNGEEYTEVIGAGTVRLVDEGRIMVTVSHPAGEIVIAGMPPSGHGSRPLVVVPAAQVDALIQAIEEVRAGPWIPIG